jgi:DNA-binding response OmpR family regulator
MTVTTGGVTHRPSRRPWLVIAYLSEWPGHVRSVNQIAEAIGTPEYDDNAVRSAIKRARRYVGDAIETRYGLGYAWVAHADW